MNATILAAILNNLPALLAAFASAAPAIEGLFPHAAGGVQDAAAKAGKLALVSQVVVAASPDLLPAGTPDSHVTHLVNNLPAVLQAAQAVQTITAAG